jgi:hypothetical protein
LGAVQKRKWSDHPRECNGFLVFMSLA